MKQETFYTVTVNGSIYTVKVEDENDWSAKHSYATMQSTQFRPPTSRQAPWVTAKRIAHQPLR